MAREVKKKTYRAAKTARTTSISNTKWNEKVAGKKGKAGRLYGPKGKLYTGTVKMGDGTTSVYKKGKKVVKAAPKKNQNRSGTGGSGGGTTTTPPSSSRTRFSSSTANRGGYSAKGYQRRIPNYNTSPSKTKMAGSGSDAVNAATSSGSAQTSSLAKTVKDSLMSIPRSRNPFARENLNVPRQKTANRPKDFPKGTAVRLTTQNGQLKYVKVGKGKDGRLLSAKKKGGK